MNECINAIAPYVQAHAETIGILQFGLAVLFYFLLFAALVYRGKEK